MDKTKEDVRLMELEHEKDILVDYLKMKVSIGDWHAVSDAANDLREIETQIRVLKAFGYDV